ncbi:MAG: hypothetical protein ABW199_07170 [Caulobacterales bacterium]
MRRLLVVLAVLMTAACVTQSRPKTFSGTIATPPAGSTIIVMAPDIQLSLLSAAGAPEPRADWSAAAQSNIAAALASNLQTQGHRPLALDPSTQMAGRSGQLIRLHDAVASSIILFNYANVRLPTHRDSFNWTLGPGTREIQTQHGARYALFIGGGGSYASAGRIATSVIVSVLFRTVATTGGGQQLYMSLIDLETGDIIWFNVASAGTGVDMREAEGARQLVNQVLEDSPL